MLSAAVRARARLVVSRGLRAYREGETVHGYRLPRKLELQPYAPEEVANRVQNANLLRLVTAYRAYGHLEADLDPLGLQARRKTNELSLAEYGLDKDLKARFDTRGILNLVDPANPKAVRTEATLEEILDHLRGTYCGRIAFEFEHLPNPSERRWFAQMVEGLGQQKFTTDDRRRIHQMLTRSEVFDLFMAKRFPQVKRYGLEGAESMIVALDSLFKAANTSNVCEIVLGMPHRGRLNLLTDLLQFSPTALFHKIMGNSELPEGIRADGDVLSHLSNSVNLNYGAESPVHVSLLHNPSHLEAVNPVAMGKARAKQMDLLSSLQETGAVQNCSLGDRVMCVQLHGDAAFTGQGIVMESLAISDIAHFSSGGSVHLIVNNQIGFTTPAVNSRSSIYTSDVGKMIQAPVIHVNGDNPEDVARAAEIAFLFRQKFRRDVIIDLVTYRRWGHNELDEPAFTQPEMYRIIRARRSVPALYESQLLKDGVITEQDSQVLRDAVYSELDQHMKAAPTYKPQAAFLQGKWANMRMNVSRDEPEPTTGVDVDLLRDVGAKSVAVPQGFVVHERLEKSHVQARIKRMNEGSLDWATAEALAFGSLLLEGYNVRLSGQDVGRGTFSHRHVMLVDQETEKVHTPLNHLSEKQGRLEVANSALSELAVLGFEYGMSLENPRLLPIWEAQFGDFFNGAQVIIDTFITSGETKWLRQSGLVMMLPHGYDGAGPEHSSCRIERFLQLSDEPVALPEDADPAPPLPNILVLNCTTPAQYFHALRRQQLREFRKPMVLVGPKTLLRLAAAVSDISELGPGTRFQPVLGDASMRGLEHRADRLILCSGKVFYELDDQRKKRGLTDVAIIRVEELSPFPFRELKAEIEKYSNASNIAWVQEEPQNNGAWSYVEPRLRSILPPEQPLVYVGRKVAATPATGISAVHKAEVKKLYDDAFSF